MRLPSAATATGLHPLDVPSGGTHRLSRSVLPDLRLPDWRDYGVDRVPGLGARAAGLRQDMADTRLAARMWTRDHGVDLPEVANWTWPG